MKLCVGAESADDLVHWQKTLLSRPGIDRPFHVTRMFPRRKDELLDGGSLYWIIKGHFSVRQKIADLQLVTAEDGTSKCRIDLDPELVTVAPLPRRPFQGWRYLSDDDRPTDHASGGEDEHLLQQELASLGLI